MNQNEKTLEELFVESYVLIVISVPLLLFILEATLLATGDKLGIHTLIPEYIIVASAIISFLFLRERNIEEEKTNHLMKVISSMSCIVAVSIVLILDQSYLDTVLTLTQELPITENSLLSMKETARHTIVSYLISGIVTYLSLSHN